MVGVRQIRLISLVFLNCDGTELYITALERLIFLFSLGKNAGKTLTHPHRSDSIDQTCYFDALFRC